MYILGLVLILCVNVHFICSQTECNFNTCGACIGYANDNCVWCSAKNHKGNRCQSKSTVGSEWCKNDVFDPKPYAIDPISSEDFNDGHNGSKVVQIKPQKMRIKARTGVPIDIKMYYKAAQNYPLDIYYVMDFSDTMKKYASDLQRQGNKLYSQLSKITNNVKFGIGSFIEKPALPYVEPNYQKSYSFKHHLSLTTNMSLFEDTLKSNTPNSVNNDEPEAGLDALMQAMVCKKEVDWRDDAHRIIILSTDATYHSSGDGKFVGAIKPNDMNCHLKDNEYSMALKFDYPSVSQINKIATEKSIMIVFAVHDNVMEDYKALASVIKNAKYVSLLKNDLVDMIVMEYKELVSKIKLNAKTPSFMTLKMDSDEYEYKHNTSIEIVSTLTINSCPSKADRLNNVIEIGPVSIHEKLKLEVEVICQCDCEKTGEINSTQCSGAGTYQCGICSCNKDRGGVLCDCDSNTTSSPNSNNCKANVNDSRSCSGHGFCSCDKCECDTGFSGDYCEFSASSCPRPGGLWCSGHGSCKKGRCECDEHWLPDDCRCPDSNKACIAPHSKEECSGRGECKCGECICNIKTKDDGYCSGRYCDECEELSTKRCGELEDYAYCNFNNEKEYCDKEFNFTDTDVILVNKSEIHSPLYYMAKIWCSKVLEDGRTLVFKYHYRTTGKRNLRIIIQNELDLPAVANVWIAVGSVIGAVLLIGLLTILAWKILVDMHDKREYDKFAKDSAAAGYEVSNVLYQPPATSFSNPAYCGDRSHK